MLRGRSWTRGVGVLAIGMLAAGALAVSPATAGKFLTKKRADKRYINVKETAFDSKKLDGKDSSEFLLADNQAYAFVDRSVPTLVANRTQGFTAVSRPYTGTYCLTPAAGITVAGRFAIAAPEWETSSGYDLHAGVVASATHCSAGQLEVITHSGSGVTDLVSFLVLVPAA